MATLRTQRKPLEEVKKYLETGMTLTDASKITHWPVSALSILARAWDIRVASGRPRIWKYVERERVGNSTHESPKVS
jgi:hypothetical protein